MKKTLLLLFFFIVPALSIGNAQASLITIGTAEYNGSDYNLIWDDNNNGKSIVWLDYSSPFETWGNQMAWASSLNGPGVLNYHLEPGYTVDWGNWRLTTAAFQGPGGFYYTRSELGHLYYNELGLPGGSSVSTTEAQLNDSPFDNLQAYVYWSGSDYRSDVPNAAWWLYMGTGYQGYGAKTTGPPNRPPKLLAIAVSTADVQFSQPVPEPNSFLLLGAGLLALTGRNRKKRVLH